MKRAREEDCAVEAPAAKRIRWEESGEESEEEEDLFGEKDSTQESFDRERADQAEQEASEDDDEARLEREMLELWDKTPAAGEQDQPANDDDNDDDDDDFGAQLQAEFDLLDAEESQPTGERATPVAAAATDDDDDMEAQLLATFGELDEEEREAASVNANLIPDGSDDDFEAFLQATVAAVQAETTKQPAVERADPVAPVADQALPEADREEALAASDEDEDEDDNEDQQQQPAVAASPARKARKAGPSATTPDHRALQQTNREVNRLLGTKRGGSLSARFAASHSEALDAPGSARNPLDVSVGAAAPGSATNPFDVNEGAADQPIDLVSGEEHTPLPSSSVSSALAPSTPSSQDLGAEQLLTPPESPAPAPAPKETKAEKRARLARQREEAAAAREAEAQRWFSLSKEEKQAEVEGRRLAAGHERDEGVTCAPEAFGRDTEEKRKEKNRVNMRRWRESQRQK